MKYRQMVSRIGIGLCFSSLALAEAPARLNVLVITSDDQGTQVGCYGDPYALTPNLDQLAADGMMFTRGYSPHASCSPARSSLLTGLYSHQNGQIGLSGSRPMYQVHARIPTLPVVLRAAGYKTGIIGKLHISPASAFPFDFDGGIPTMETRDVRRVADRAADFLDQYGDQPFFLYVNYFDPHRPFSNQVANLPASPYTGDDVASLPFLRVDTPEMRAEVAGYYNGIRRMDTGVGMLLAELELSGNASNTIVLFVGDQGADFPRAKTSSYEAGEQVPFIMRWPGIIPPASVSDELVSFVDVMPTLLEAIGIDPTPYHFAGRPLQPLFDGTPAPDWRTALMGSYTSHGATHLYPRRSLRDVRWKLIHNLDYIRPNPVPMLGLARTATAIDEEARQAYETFYNPPEYELYDLQNDPYELRNLSDDPAYASELVRLQAILHAQREATDDAQLDQWEVDRLKRAHDIAVPLPPDTGFMEVSASFVPGEYVGQQALAYIGFARDDEARICSRNDTVIAAGLVLEGAQRGAFRWRLLLDQAALPGHDLLTPTLNTNWNPGDVLRMALAYHPVSGIITVQAFNATTGELINRASVTNAGIIGLNYSGLEVYGTQALRIEDDFNRPDTGYANASTVPSVIGANWISGGVDSNATFRIVNYQLDYGSGSSASQPAILVHTAQETLNTAGHTFTFSAVATQDNNINAASGLVWNYQDSGNFYYARYLAGNRALQFFRWVNGVQYFLASSSGAAFMPDWVNGKQYEWTVTSVKAYEFTIQVKDLDTGDTLTHNAIDVEEWFSGGYAGFMAGTGALFFDDFRLDVRPMSPLPSPAEDIMDVKTRRGVNDPTEGFARPALSLRLGGASKALSFDSSSKGQYTVYASSDLLHDSWEAIYGPTWGGDSSRMIVIPEEELIGFYRVQVEVP